MVDINLFPWREMKKARKQRFNRIVVIIILCCLVISVFKKSIGIRKPLNETIHQEQQPFAPLPHMKFIGYFHQQNQTIGVVLLPNGMTQEIQVGTYLPNGLRVYRIDENKLELITAVHSLVSLEFYRKKVKS